MPVASTPSVFSPELITAIFTGLSLLMTGILGFTYKIWKDHNKIVKEMHEATMKVSEKSLMVNKEMTDALYKLKDSTDKNTEVSKSTVEATKANTDTLSKLMLELIRIK